MNAITTDFSGMERNDLSDGIKKASSKARSKGLEMIGYLLIVLKNRIPYEAFPFPTLSPVSSVTMDAEIVEPEASPARAYDEIDLDAETEDINTVDPDDLDIDKTLLH